jgi:HEPN domain-containing protein
MERSSIPHDPIRLADTRAWLARAHDDVRGAEIDLAALPPLLGDVTFHCQQAVEKTLRGYLTWHDHGFRKTHDLTELGGACVELDPSLETVLRRAATLTEYAWRYRYPGEPNAPEEAEAREALALARVVISEILGRLPAEARR